MLTSWARRSEDLTSDKTDERDAVLIARLTAQLRCYVPEPVDEAWGRLRHLGARREPLVIDMVSQVQQVRALLECVWPAALDTAEQPFRSRTWAAAMTVICERDGGDLARTQRLGVDRFAQAVRREITRRGGYRPSLRILRQLFTALADPTGVTAHRRGALVLLELRVVLVEVEDRHERRLPLLRIPHLGIVLDITPDRREAALVDHGLLPVSGAEPVDEAPRCGLVRSLRGQGLEVRRREKGIGVEEVDSCRILLLRR